MGSERRTLTDGARVAVVGGGPAGSFFALYALHYARQLGRRLSLTIYEPKTFACPGPGGCNMCAGILSSSLVRNLRDLDIALPSSVVLGHIGSYRLHTPFGQMEVPEPDPEASILSVYRGGGPRGSDFSTSVSFDDFLLSEAVARGAEVLSQRVEELSWEPDPSVATEDGEREYDLVVLACGVNSALLQRVPAPYGPPPTQRMAQDELWAGEDAVKAALGDRVHMFLLRHSSLVFGTLIPKGPYINVSLLSRRNQAITIEEFLALDLVRPVLPPDYRRSCGCQPRIALGPARHPFADGFVAVGDACVTRLYKDGIGSALVTARQAAHTALYYGVSQEDFHRYYLPTYRALAWDNRFGRLLFAAHDRAKNSRWFFRAQVQLMEQEEAMPYARRSLDQIIWGMFTGAYSYRSIVGRMVNPRLWLGLLRAVLPGGAGLVPGPRRARGPAGASTKQVVILGGGFAGVYTTLHLERALRRDHQVAITLVSDENFLLFTPLLHEVATGGIETRHIAHPIRRLRGDRRFTFVQAEVISVDLGRRVVHTSQGGLSYDYLVLALGSVTDMRSLPGQATNAFTLKTLRDGILLRNHVIRMFELADAHAADQRPFVTFVVAGGGYSGVQLVADLADFIHRSLLKEYSRVARQSVRIILVQDVERILADMDARLAAIATRLLRAKGIEVISGARVTRVWPDRVEVSPAGVIPTHTLIWTTGILANPVVSGLAVEKDATGRVVVDEHLEVPGFPGVYALGDNAHFKDPLTGKPLPPTAHIAVRQPKTVAANIVADLGGRPKRPYRYQFMGEMVSLGSRSAVANFYGHRFHGFLMRVVWLVAYLSITPGIYNRIRVASDWFLGLFFGRDSTLLRVQW